MLFRSEKSNIKIQVERAAGNVRMGEKMERGQGMDQQKHREKSEALKEILQNMGSVAVAFSGGVDSTFLLKTAHDVLGDNAVAVTAKAASFPERETGEADDFCKKEGIRQLVFAFDELAVKGFAQNPENRCYLCKRELL